jgi:hypothetical protein
MLSLIRSGSDMEFEFFFQAKILHIEHQKFLLARRSRAEWDQTKNECRRIHLV